MQTVKQTIVQAPATLVLAARLYRELALSALSLIPRRD